MTDFDGIEKIAEMFALSDIPASEDGKILGGFQGFVVPPDFIHAYGKPALSLTARVTIAPAQKLDKSVVVFFASVSSIDDSGLSFFGPAESKEKAMKRLDAFRVLMTEWHPNMPPMATLEEWGQRWQVALSPW